MPVYMESPQTRHPGVLLAGVQNCRKTGFRSKACRNGEVGISRFVVTLGIMKVSTHPPYPMTYNNGQPLITAHWSLLLRAHQGEGEGRSIGAAEIRALNPDQAPVIENDVPADG
jgi:hypothetical protein